MICKNISEVLLERLIHLQSIIMLSTSEDAGFRSITRKCAVANTTTICSIVTCVHRFTQASLNAMALIPTTIRASWKQTTESLVLLCRVYFLITRESLIFSLVSNDFTIGFASTTELMPVSHSNFRLSRMNTVHHLVPNPKWIRLNQNEIATLTWNGDAKWDLRKEKD